MHRFRNQLTVSAVALLLGVLVVAQLRAQQAAPGLSGLSSQELTQVVANLSTRNDQLRTEVQSLEREATTLASSQSRGASSVDQLGSDLARVRAWIGLQAVFGPGVTVTISGPIDGPAVESLINELRNAGAEAIAVGTVRVVPGTVVTGSAGHLTVEDATLGDPFEVRAIGSPESLTGALTRAGGVVAQLGATYPDALVTVTPVDRMDLPATTRSLTPVHGQPRL